MLIHSYTYSALLDQLDQLEATWQRTRDEQEIAWLCDCDREVRRLGKRLARLERQYRRIEARLNALAQHRRAQWGLA